MRLSAYLTARIHNRLRAVLLLCCGLLPLEALAQGFSFDGNRWYEIEVSIFTQEPFGSANSELFVPERSLLFYPQRITELRPAYDSYRFDFSVPADGPRNNFAIPAVTQNPSPPVYGPRNLQTSSGFRLQDLQRDPFIALGSNAGNFAAMNRNLQNSPNHRLLYHAVWRQAVLNRSQATAVFVRGGDDYGDHSELEGSLTMSFNVNRVVVDALLWRSVFSNRDTSGGWHLPPSPFPVSDTEVARYGIEQVYRFSQSRPMISNELHYLDHPALGLLIEVRPYTLPLPEEDGFSGN